MLLLCSGALQTPTVRLVPGLRATAQLAVAMPATVLRLMPNACLAQLGTTAAALDQASLVTKGSYVTNQL